MLQSPWIPSRGTPSTLAMLPLTLRQTFFEVRTGKLEVFEVFAEPAKEKAKMLNRQKQSFFAIRDTEV